MQICRLCKTASASRGGLHNAETATTMPPTMKHDDLITRLGGNAVVGRRLGRDATTVSRWRMNGIPPVAWPAVLRLARMVHIDLTIDELQASSPLYGRTGTSPRRVKRSARLKELA